MCLPLPLISQAYVNKELRNSRGFWILCLLRAAEQIGKQPNRSGEWSPDVSQWTSLSDCLLHQLWCCGLCACALEREMLSSSPGHMCSWAQITSCFSKHMVKARRKTEPEGSIPPLQCCVRLLPLLHFRTLGTDPLCSFEALVRDGSVREKEIRSSHLT